MKQLTLDPESEAESSEDSDESDEDEDEAKSGSDDDESLSDDDKPQKRRVAPAKNSGSPAVITKRRPSTLAGDADGKLDMKDLNDPGVFYVMKKRFREVVVTKLASFKVAHVALDA